MQSKNFSNLTPPIAVTINRLMFWWNHVTNIPPEQEQTDFRQLRQALQFIRVMIS